MLLGLLHSHAIITDGTSQLLILGLGDNLNMPCLALLFKNAMQDGVFYNWLQDHMQYHAIRQLLRHMQGIADPVSKAAVLQLQIKAKLIKLLAQGNEVQTVV